MARARRTLVCQTSTGAWSEVKFQEPFRWEGGAWRDVEGWALEGMRCPGPKGQKIVRKALGRRRRSGFSRLSTAVEERAFRLDGIGSFAPRKGSPTHRRSMPAVDVDDEPRPEPRPGLKLCECGLPVIPGTDMCERCALLDYGTTSTRVVSPGHVRGRSAAKRATIIGILRDRPEGATITEILQDMGEAPRDHRARNSLQIFFDRWVGKSEGRLIKRPCIRKRQRAVCYHLDAPRRRRRRR